MPEGPEIRRTADKLVEAGGTHRASFPATYWP